MSEPELRLKVELHHSPREQIDADAVADEVQRMVNHPEERVSNIRYAVGHQASAVFVQLIPRRWSGRSIQQVVNSVIHWTEWNNYAAELEQKGWQIEAVQPGDSGGD